VSIINSKNLEKSFGDLKALKDISFEINKGEIVGFLGPNGAGKSTTIEILTGQIERDSGELEVLGQDPEDDPVELRSRLGILPEREDPPSFLTGREYFEFISDIRDEEVDEANWIERLHLEGKLDKLTHNLSKVKDRS